MGLPTEDIEDKLNQIVFRRNQIVHEGDIMRSSRPQKLKYNKIDHSKIKDDVEWLNLLINSIDKSIVK